MTSPKPVRLCDMRQNSVYDVLVKVQDIRLVHVFKFFYLKIDFPYKKVVRVFMRFAAGVSDFFLKRLFHAEMIHGIVRKFFEYYRHFSFVHAFVAGGNVVKFVGYCNQLFVLLVNLWNAQKIRIVPFNFCNFIAHVVLLIKSQRENFKFRLNF